MYNLIVYGSLLHPEELKKHNVDIDTIDLVKVKGFIRVFNQLPSWRKVEGIKKAVLNIEEDKKSWFNALVIKGLKEEYFKELDIRERGYDKVFLNDKDVVSYNGEFLKNCIVYKGKWGKQSLEILPNPDYFQICKSGAKSYSKEFYEDYLRTTYENDLRGGIKLIVEK